MTKEVIEKMRARLTEPRPKIVEYYPLSWKKIPEIRDICEARVANGIGIWVTPVDQGVLDSERRQQP